jgi:hypothetical protein
MDVPEWQPEVRVSPVTSTTIDISVTVPVSAVLHARLFPADAPAVTFITLTQVGAWNNGQLYTGTFTLTDPALEGYVQVWAGADPIGSADREIVTEYAINGNPRSMGGRGGHIRGHGGHIRGHGAPAISADGQVILFSKGIDLDSDQFIVLQPATVLPAVPSWATVTGKGYWLATSAKPPNLENTSISFGYLGSEVPPGEEQWLRIYFWNEKTWEPLPTQLDTDYNMASALTRGPGLYALMSSIEISLTGPGWNLIAYPSHLTRTVTEALQSIAGSYTLVYGHNPQNATNPWDAHGKDAPDCVGKLHEMQFGRGYWINVTKPVTLRLKGGLGVAVLSAPIPSAAPDSSPVPLDVCASVKPAP